MNEANETHNTLIINDDNMIIEKISKNNVDEFQLKKYKKIRLLGKGGFAHCYELFDEETHHSVAGKIIPKRNLIKSRAKQKLISEIKIHKSIHHENIVKFEHYFEDTDNVYMLTELCTNQTLHELLRRRKTITELEVQYYVYQLIKALKYLHNLKIIHRDLKLANLFLSENMELKLGDFGLATKIDFDGERKRSLCGTPNYIAPEVLDGKTGHSFEVDIWGIGIIIYVLLIGKLPFETNNKKETYKRIRLKNYSFPQNAKLSEPAKELIQNILVLEPHKRPSLDDILKSDFMNMGTSIPKTIEAEKYGFGYILSNGNVGVYFNDNTKILYKPNGNNFVYIDNNEKAEFFMFKQELSKDLNKKVILLKTFKGYLFEEAKDTKESNTGEGILANQYIYLRKFAKTKHSILFRLSNKTVQINFHDNTEIILSQENKTVTYINKKGEKFMYPLNIALDTDNKEMTKRLRYTKKILFKMLTSRGYADIHKIIY